MFCGFLSVVDTSQSYIWVWKKGDNGCFRKNEGLTVNLLLATFRVTLFPEGDVDSLEVGVASPLTLPSLELPLSGSESAF